MLNSSDVQQQIDRSPRLQMVGNAGRRNPVNAIRMIYLTILSRYPTRDEEATARQYYQTTGCSRSRPRAIWRGR